MDGISIIQTAVPLIVAIIFTVISISDIKEQFQSKKRSSLTPIWTMIAGLAWIFFGIVSLYGGTTAYLSSLTYFYFIVGFLFFPVLFFATIIQNISLSGQEKEANEMRLE